MVMEFLGTDGAAIAALVIVALMFALFVSESYPAEVVAILGVAVLLILGLLPYQQALDVLANPAPWIATTSAG